MKRSLLFYSFLLIVSLSSCNIYIDEPLYNLSGHYRVDEYSHHYDEYFRYSIYIDQPHINGPDDVIFIENFYNADIVVEAYLNGSRINIPYQEIGPFDIQGSGYISDGNIHLDATIWEHVGYSTIRDDIEIDAY
ncbi:hypothetical protein [Marinigracilibium pacificum]|uniref:Lipoprotein n=1 Tax=Marinigracilibium pacificum TaxID=2729599 RepID=A0A848IV71_9BACT|nr:hypothetical protein [Marinigracilibium pacificum]NMM48393.1 hypothetical protein [Marinigracilibium pacificum]